MRVEIFRDKTKKRFDRWAENYDESVLSPFFDYTHKKIIGSLKLFRGEKILDVGCGTGKLLDKINSLNNCPRELVGIDISEGMINIAREKRPKNLSFFVSDAGELSFEDDYFDAVINATSFHHYPEQERVLKEMYRVLKPAGKLYLADLSFSYPPGLVYLMAPVINFIEGPAKVNSRRKMKEMFKENGFEVLSVNNLAFIQTLYICRK
ncbi:MAG: methyltransferase domain-containing protein [Nanoarchaeota archaeon]